METKIKNTTKTFASQKPYPVTEPLMNANPHPTGWPNERTSAKTYPTLIDAMLVKTLQGRNPDYVNIRARQGASSGQISLVIRRKKISPIYQHPNFTQILWLCIARWLPMKWGSKKLNPTPNSPTPATLNSSATCPTRCWLPAHQPPQ